MGVWCQRYQSIEAEEYGGTEHITPRRPGSREKVTGMGQGEYVPKNLPPKKALPSTKFHLLKFSKLLKLDHFLRTKLSIHQAWGMLPI